MDSPPTITLTLRVGRELDGRWFASVPEFPGVHAYGNSESEAVRKVRALAYFEVADRLEHDEPLPGDPGRLEFVAA